MGLGQANLYCVMFKKSSSSVLLEYKNTRRSRVFLDQIKHVLQDFWTALKTFQAQKVCVLGVLGKGSNCEEKF